VQVSPTSVRGTLGSLNQLMICLGILAALLVNVALPVTDWRLMFNLAAAPAIILLLGEGIKCCCSLCCVKLTRAEGTGEVFRPVASLLLKSASLFFQQGCDARIP
jgi:MFS family permease